METLLNVTAMFPQVWTKEQIEEFEKYSWCTDCKKLVYKDNITYQHTGDEPDE